MIRTYTELTELKTFEDRFNYLKLNSTIGDTTFGFDRWLNQSFYKSREWLEVRNYVIIRDGGFDLGCKDRPIKGLVIVHHMNPMNIKDVKDFKKSILNPEYLITTSKHTHDLIHFGSKLEHGMTEYTERKPWDTCPWRK